MKIYTVHLPPADSPYASDPVRTELVREGFSWGAFLFAVPWLLINRMWLMLVVYVVAMISLGVAAETLGGPVPELAILLLHIYFATEANQLLRWRLARRGWRFAGVTGGGTYAEAEIRAFADGPVGHRPVQPFSDVVPRAAVQPRATADVVGLFPEPGGKPA